MEETQALDFQLGSFPEDVQETDDLQVSSRHLNMPLTVMNLTPEVAAPGNC